MYGKYTTLSSSATSNNNSSSETTSRMAVADILSTMAVNGHEAITPSTYAALEGFSTGVLTQTTPTLTPTTLRSIEQTFIELQAVPPPHSLTRHNNEAGFVPPIVNVLPSAASVISAIANHGLQLPPTTTNGATVIVPSSSDSTTASSSTAAFLGGDAHNGSTVTTYQTLTAKSVASIGGCNSSNNDGNGMSSSASSSGSSTTSASDIINDNNSWSGIGNNNNSSLGGGRTSGGQTTPKAKGRNMGGRRPAKYEKLTPEEEERRRVRRERNKLAAARCRKRRMDHTNSLIYETEGLEDQRSSLQSEIQDLQSQKDELEFILEAHKVVCKLQRQALQHCHREHRDRSSHQQDYGRDDDIELSHPQPEQGQKVQVQREEPVDVKPDLSQLNVAIQQHQAKRSRPNSLALSSTFAVPRGVPQQQQQQQLQHPATSGSSSSNRLSLTEATGISITTPSNGMFNFEALMEGGTGLTPVSCSGGTGLTPIAVPSCSTQQRSSSSNNNNGDCLSSPEGSLNGPPKLVSL